VRNNDIKLLIRLESIYKRPVQSIGYVWFVSRPDGVNFWISLCQYLEKNRLRKTEKICNPWSIKLSSTC